MRQIIGYIIVLAVFGLVAHPVRANEITTADASAKRADTSRAADPRVAKLRLFLKSYNSPFSAEAAYFVAEADRLGLDWKLVAAIAGVESTFGRFVPRRSYNGWGWGIFTGQNDGIHFKSWKDGITTVSEGLKFRYINRGATTIEHIGRIYATSPTWSSKVRFFLRRIEEFEPAGIHALTVTI